MVVPGFCELVSLQAPCWGAHLQSATPPSCTGVHRRTAAIQLPAVLCCLSTWVQTFLPKIMHSRRDGSCHSRPVWHRSWAPVQPVQTAPVCTDALLPSSCLLCCGGSAHEYRHACQQSCTAGRTAAATADRCGTGLGHRCNRSRLHRCAPTHCCSPVACCGAPPSNSILNKVAFKLCVGAAAGLDAASAASSHGLQQDKGCRGQHDFNCFGSIRVLRACNRLPELPIATRKARSGAQEAPARCPAGGDRAPAAGDL